MKVFPINKLRFVPPPGRSIEQGNIIQANIRANVGLPKMQLPPHEGRVAVVGYGPSLKYMWMQLRDFDFVWTTSGAHDFLVKRDVVPTYHTHIDWRMHEPAFATPHSGVHYVLGNTVAPDYISRFDHSRLGVFQPVGDGMEEWAQLGDYPRIESPGDVGVTTVCAAYAAGFRDIHVFGMDCSHEFDGRMKSSSVEAVTHAGPNTRMLGSLIYVTDGRLDVFETTRHLLATCADFAKVTARLSDATFTIASDGLLASWMDMDKEKA